MAYTPDPEKLKNISFSIVIETENLGMAGIADLEETLLSLEAQKYSIKNAKEVLIIAGGHVAPETLRALKYKYSWLTIHQEPHKLEYMESKMRGAEVATGDIVVFVDSDAVYEPDWLLQMLHGFVAAPGASIISSETRVRIVSIYTATLQLMWMINAVKNMPHPIPTVQFHLNNFSIKRSAMLAVPVFKDFPIYRANNVEWKKQLQFRGFSAMRVPGIMSHHAPPGNFTDWWYRMLIQGADAVSKADFKFNYDGTFVEKFSPIRRLCRVPMFIAFKIYVMVKRSHALVSEDWKNTGYVLIAWPISFVFLAVVFLGSCVALFNRDYVFKKITARESEHVV